MSDRAAGIVSAVIALIAAAAAAWFIYQTPGTVFDGVGERRVAPLPGSELTLLVTIEQGQGADEIGAELEAQGIIRSGQLFEVLVGLMGVQNSLEAGDYEFEQGIPAVEAVQRIASGQTASNFVTIPEGLRNAEIAAILEGAGIVPAQEFLDALVKERYDEPFLQQVNSDSLEGFLFPARYEFSRGAGVEEVVGALLRGFQTNVADRLELEGQGMSLEEVVTLAAVVEREAVTKEERPIIAGVFLNRLRLGIPLQADPTVQYSLTADPANVATFGWWKQPLLFDDLKIESPYNTYVNPGLPPGPIANPGFASIEAVVRPAATDFLFFVAKDDGTHVFAETLEEHERNVAEYQPQ